jgi:hypothetical protein
MSFAGNTRGRATYGLAGLKRQKNMLEPDNLDLWQGGPGRAGLEQRGAPLAGCNFPWQALGQLRWIAPLWSRNPLW